jgi:hypothetical protein
MERTYMTGLCLVTLFAFSAAVAGSASALPPEFQVLNKKTKKYEPLMKPVTLKAAAELSPRLRVGSAPSLECVSSSGKGKLTGPKTLTLQTRYKGCKEPESQAACQSGKKAGEIKTSLEGTLAHASATAVEPPVVAVSMPGLGGYTCGTTKFVVNGRLLGAVTPTGEPVSEITITDAEGVEPEPGCGKQELQLVEGIGPCVHLGLTSGSGPDEPAWMVAEEKWKPHGTVSVLK